MNLSSINLLKPDPLVRMKPIYISFLILFAYFTSGLTESFILGGILMAAEMIRIYNFNKRAQIPVFNANNMIEIPPQEGTWIDTSIFTVHVSFNVIIFYIFCNVMINIINSIFYFGFIKTTFMIALLGIIFVMKNKLSTHFSQYSACSFFIESCNNIHQKIIGFASYFISPETSFWNSASNFYNSYLHGFIMYIADVNFELVNNTISKSIYHELFSMMKDNSHERAVNIPYIPSNSNLRPPRFPSLRKQIIPSNDTVEQDDESEYTDDESENYDSDDSDESTYKKNLPNNDNMSFLKNTNLISDQVDDLDDLGDDLEKQLDLEDKKKKNPPTSVIANKPSRTAEENKKALRKKIADRRNRRNGQGGNHGAGCECCGHQTKADMSKLTKMMSTPEGLETLAKEFPIDPITKTPSIDPVKLNRVMNQMSNTKSEKKSDKNLENPTVKE
jgi:hypothetical protein